MVQSLAFKATYFLILFLALCWCLCWLDHSHWMKQKEHSSLWQTNRNLQNKWIAKTSDKNNTHIYIYMFNSLPEFRFQDPFCFLIFFCSFFRLCDDPSDPTRRTAQATPFGCAFRCGAPEGASEGTLATLVFVIHTRGSYLCNSFDEISFLLKQ